MRPARRLEEQAPEEEPARREQAHADEDAKEDREGVERESARTPAPHLADQPFTARVERLRLVDVAEQVPVPFQQGALVEHRLEVRPSELIAGRVGTQPPFPFQPAPERRIRQGGEQANHRGSDGEAGDERPLRLEDVVAVGVESDDEAGVDLEPGAGQAQDRFLKRQLEVLQLVRVLERLDGRSLDPEEHGGESCLHH